MPFAFDDAKRFHDNLEAYLKELDSIDGAMATILRANLSELHKVCVDGERSTQARGKFNEKILTALDKLVEEEASKEGE